MTRESESRLVDFCVAQYQGFDPSAWLTFDAVSRTELAVVALFLAGVDWFGRPHEPLTVTDAIQPGCAGHFSAVARESRFDTSRSSHQLRRALALHESGVC